MTDPIVDAVCAKLQSRSAVGIKKYGTTLAGNYATVKEKLIHIQEELMDAANYVEWLLQEEEMATTKEIVNAAMKPLGIDIEWEERETMPTPMTIEMEDNARQAALDAIPTSIYDPLDNNTKKIDILLMARWFYVHANTIRAALQSAQVKAETVDLEKLREDLAAKLSTLIPHSYSDAVFYNLFDCITGEFNITRKTK